MNSGGGGGGGGEPFKAEQSEKGWHFEAKSKKLLATATTTRSDLKLNEKGPAAHFDFHQGFFGATLYIRLVSKLLRHHSKSDLNFAR